MVLVGIEMVRVDDLNVKSWKTQLNSFQYLLIVHSSFSYS